MKANSEFEVLAVVTAKESRKGENEIIFVTEKGKIYFIDKKNMSGYENVTVGEKYLAWVVKDFDTVGYIRLTINNKSILDFIKSLENKDNEYFLNLFKHNVDEEVMIYNYLYNHDIDFNKYLSESSEKQFKDAGFYAEFSKLVDRIGINSEQTEARLDTAFAFNYLYQSFVTGKAKWSANVAEIKSVF